MWITYLDATLSLRYLFSILPYVFTLQYRQSSLQLNRWFKGLSKIIGHMKSVCECSSGVCEKGGTVRTSVNKIGHEGRRSLSPNFALTLTLINWPTFHGKVLLKIWSIYSNSACYLTGKLLSQSDFWSHPDGRWRKERQTDHNNRHIISLILLSRRSECWTCDQQVAGSNPGRRAVKWKVEPCLLACLSLQAV